MSNDAPDSNTAQDTSWLTTPFGPQPAGCFTSDQVSGLQPLPGNADVLHVHVLTCALQVSVLLRGSADLHQLQHAYVHALGTIHIGLHVRRRIGHWQSLP